MQLGRVALSLATTFVLVALSEPALADDLTTRGGVEVAAYQDSVATSVLTPSLGVGVESPTAGWRIDGRYLVDVVTTASPDIVATASPKWTEVRHAGTLGARYKPDTFGVAVTGSTSYTPDYLSLGIGGQLIEELDEKNLTLTEGYAFGHDTIGRTGTPFSIFSRSLVDHTLTLGVSRVVNPALLLSLVGDLILESGDQSKPYRYIPMFAPNVALTIPRGASPDVVAAKRLQARPLEQLPLSRQRGALTGKLAWRSGNTTLRFDERFYGDSWSLIASTTDARLYVDTSERVMIWPHLRAHVQNGVSFWQLAYAAKSVDDLPALRTGDRELGPLTNLGAGGGIRLALGKEGVTDDITWTTTIDGSWTRFADALFVTQRWSGLVSSSFEVAF